MKIDKPLWEYTRDLHHACEAHEVGAAMATGKPPRLWYLAWCVAIFQIHEALDIHCDSVLQRSDELLFDYGELMLELDIQPEWSVAATKYIEQLDTKKKIDGGIYVLSGAHLMGGAIMQKRLVGYPTRHLEWNDRKGAIEILQKYRLRDDIGDEARACFAALLEIMDEIKERFPNGDQG